jgi:hypothetical protein
MGIDSEEVAVDLVRAARDFLETWPNSTVECVYFLAYADRDKALCRTAFQRIGLEREGVEPSQFSARITTAGKMPAEDPTSMSS